MPLIGTAGHVDHGKSTLIEALTGRDPDRWEEEKRRGLTIDLGFAWARLGDHEVSFVDVPGHERYLKNMLAGVDPIDLALFVVAADEGWMPQSEEHLAVLDLLGIGDGVIAVTKADLVDDDLLELAKLEVSEQLVGTGLEGSPVVGVSAVDGHGMEELRSLLVAGLGNSAPDNGRPRLWVDRSFTISGAGTVVTGTLTDGSLSVGDTVEILPTGEIARIRGLQSHETEISTALPGRRLAVNLGGIEPAQAPRGSMVGIPSTWRTTDRITARVKPARYAEMPGPKGDYQVHVGSGAHPADVMRIEDDVALLKLGTPIPLQSGDRFIIRDTGRKLVVAGGVVLDPQPGATVRAIRRSGTIHPQEGADSVASALLTIRGSDSVDGLAADSGGGFPSQAEVISGVAFEEGLLDDLRARAIALIEEDHRLHPLRTGLPVAALATSLGNSLEVVQHIVETSSGIERVGPDVRVHGHQPRWAPEHETAWQRAHNRLDEDLAVPNADQLGLDTELLHLLVREGKLIRISDSLVVLPGQAKVIESAVATMHDGFTVSEFRDATGLSRKHSVPYLEWADDKGLTVRRGNLRHHR